MTKAIKEANAGGAAAHMLARLGIQAIVLEGCAEQWTALKIDKTGLTFFTVAGLLGKGIKACIDSMREAHGDSLRVISIGQAGEMALTAAGIAVTSPDHFPRMAARGGLGAVMGSKKIKLIVIDDTGCTPPEVKNWALFMASVKAFTQGITSHPLDGGLKRFGTPMCVGLINELGGTASKDSHGYADRTA